MITADTPSTRTVENAVRGTQKNLQAFLDSAEGLFYLMCEWLESYGETTEHPDFTLTGSTKHACKRVLTARNAVLVEQPWYQRGPAVRKLTDGEAAEALDLSLDVFQRDIKPEIKAHPDGIPVTEIVRLNAEGGVAKVLAAKEANQLVASDERRLRRRPQAEKEAPFVDFLQPLSPGPRIKIASALHRAGVSSWDGIAAMSEEELRHIMTPSRVAESLCARLHEYALSHGGKLPAAGTLTPIGVRTEGSA